jgi:hypothetical protein
MSQETKDSLLCTSFIVALIIAVSPVLFIIATASLPIGLALFLTVTAVGFYGIYDIWTYGKNRT